MIRPNATTTPSSASTDITSSTSCETARPRRSAAAFTGLGDVPLPRPRRLSTLVTNRAMSCPAVTSAFEWGTRHLRRAEIDEPHYCSRLNRDSAGIGAASSLQTPVLLHGFLALIGLLGRTSTRRCRWSSSCWYIWVEFVGLSLDDLTVDVDAADQQGLRAQSRRTDPGSTGNPRRRPLTVGLDDLGVEDDLLLTRPRSASARRSAAPREADDTTFVQRREHVVDETDELAVDIGDLGGLRLQNGVTEGSDRVRHGVAGYRGRSRALLRRAARGHLRLTHGGRRPAMHFHDGDRPRRCPPTATWTSGTAPLLGEVRNSTGVGRPARPGLWFGANPMALALRSPAATVWATPDDEWVRLKLTTHNAESATGSGTSGPPRRARCHPTSASPRSGLTDGDLRSHPSTSDGTAVLVVQKHLGADSLQRWLHDALRRMASSRAGFRLFESRRAADRAPIDPTISH